MTQAKLTRIAPDPTLASAFLDRARSFLDDGSAKDLSQASRQVLLHNAAIAACDAVLAVSGFQVEGSERGHRLRLEKAEELLSGDLVDLFERLESVRMTRADISYRAGFALDPDVDEA